MNKVARIDSKLYYDLYEKGGDRLIAAYSILKTSRNNEIKYYAHTAKNGKVVSGYSLLRSKTVISLNSLKVYVPILIEMGLCYFDTNGDFVLLGSKKLKEKYTNKKIVPILIGKNIIDTAHNAISVRLFSAERQQIKQIEVKQNRRELLTQAVDPKNLKLFKKAKRVLKKYSGVEITITDKTVLSNQGFAKIKDGEENNKSRGAYWKRILKQKSIVKTQRRFENICEIPYADYLKLKYSGQKPRNHTYYKGFLCIELVSSFSTVDKTKCMVC